MNPQITFSSLSDLYSYVRRGEAVRGQRRKAPRVLSSRNCLGRLGLFCVLGHWVRVLYFVRLVSIRVWVKIGLKGFI
ncbi:hypothetical protein ES332_A06G191700v1 [Gossypium tomentosum]|uniref:Uncharacterized protein n=1 Tax=Gossypium tomentosum TaxID=34277 RepID=A0A5D2Q5V3_GOSTO|nr:hypothetical protein ES332_A06G191700v1 [Gossypium tomentosum]